MDQNTIAVIWDFDKTLIPGYMQEPLFRRYSIDSGAFWQEVNSLPARYREMGIKVNKDTIYLSHLLTCVRQGIFPGLNNRLLLELGRELEFYPGVPDIFQAMKDVVKNEKYLKFQINVEHYIVSTGLSQMIRGSQIARYADGIWGCEFIENPVRSELNNPELSGDNTIRQTGCIVDNTSKTRAVFEISKGANKFSETDVNSRMAKEDRRVPFENMICITDGPSDVPAFSIIRQYGGKSLAVYPEGDVSLFRQVNELIKDGRIDMLAAADYSKGKTACMWLTSTVEEIAERIYTEHQRALELSAGRVSAHQTS